MRYLVFYWAGRIFQLIGLMAMPSAIWIGHFEHDEQGAIAVFLASLLVFFIGYLFDSLAKKG